MHHVHVCIICMTLYIANFYNWPVYNNIIIMHVACRWKDDVESNTVTTKDSVETGKEKSTWLRLKEKLISTWRRVWGYSQLTHPLRIMVTSLIYYSIINYHVNLW